MRDDVAAGGECSTHVEEESIVNVARVCRGRSTSILEDAEAFCGRKGYSSLGCSRLAPEEDLIRGLYCERIDVRLRAILWSKR